MQLGVRYDEAVCRLQISHGSSRLQMASAAICQLPGLLLRIHENPLRVARRLVTVTFGISERNVVFSDLIEQVDDVHESPSCPGLKTVYRKLIIDAAVGNAEEGFKYLEENGLSTTSRGCHTALEPKRRNSSHVQKYLGDRVKNHNVPGKNTWYYLEGNEMKRPWDE